MLSEYYLFIHFDDVVGSTQTEAEGEGVLEILKSLLELAGIILLLNLC